MIDVAQKYASVRTTSRPSIRSSPSLASPANSAVATRGIATIDNRFLKMSPIG